MIFLSECQQAQEAEVDSQMMPGFGSRKDMDLYYKVLFYKNNE